MTRLEDRQILLRDITQARADGSRLAPACALAGLDPRTLQRWKIREDVPRRDRRAEADRPVPSHALSEAERARIIEVANEPRFAEAPPARIVPALADEGIYIASESSFHRVLRAHGQMHRRGRAQPPRISRPPATHVATRPGEVWCWDVTFLPAQIRGRWFYLYLILDLYSRKIVGFEVHDTDSAEHAAHLARRTALAEGVHAMPVRPVLHGDNGATLRATTVLAMSALARHQTLLLPPAGQRRQCLRRGAVPHRQVSARVPAQRVRRAGHCPAMGGTLRPLVQRRASPQRHSLCHARAASCRPRSLRIDGASCALQGGTRAQPAALDWCDPKLEAGHRRHPQSRARHADNTATRTFQFDRRAGFPAPTWQRPGHGAQRRRWEERSHPQSRAAQRA